MGKKKKSQARNPTGFTAMADELGRVTFDADQWNEVFGDDKKSISTRQASY